MSRNLLLQTKQIAKKKQRSRFVNKLPQILKKEALSVH